ncbi:hypothetical protein AHiyo6_12850 [Arthrobacter sp. Hiyo6]|nr:hypothetical protein AHiyo6_12850 [Arthrobacter sp. Hiyo6]
MPMRWGDMDAYGHVNNVQIVRMLEEARIGAFGPPRGAGLPGAEPEVSLFNDVEEGTMALVVEHRIRYVKTLEYRNIPAVVQLWIGAVKGASFDIHYLVQDRDRGGLREGEHAPSVRGRGDGPGAAADSRAETAPGTIRAIDSRARSA